MSRTPIREPALDSIRRRNPWSSGSDCAGLRQIGTPRRSIEVAPAAIDDRHRLRESIEIALAGFGKAVATGADSRMRIVSRDPTTSDPPGNHPVGRGRSPKGDHVRGSAPRRSGRQSSNTVNVFSRSYEQVLRLSQESGRVRVPVTDPCRCGGRASPTGSSAPPTRTRRRRVPRGSHR